MNKKVLEVRVIHNEEIAENVWSIVIEYPSSIAVRPGQFVNVYLNRRDLLLPRPISICRAEGERLTLLYGVVGKGTEELSTYRANTLIRVSTPLGNGYNLKEIEGNSPRQLSAMVVGGGIGVPPLLELTYNLVAMGLHVNAVIGFRKEPFLVTDLKAAGATVYVATDNGSEGFHGDVIGLIEKESLSSDYYFACGPKPMLKAISKHCACNEKDVQVSLEERMGCGYGACVGCTCKIRTFSFSDKDVNIVRKRVCKDGPVFWGKEVVWDE